MEWSKSDIVHIALGCTALLIWAFGDGHVPADLVGYAKMVAMTLGGSAAGIAVAKNVTNTLAGTGADSKSS